MLPLITYEAETLILTKISAENMRAGQRALKRAMLEITKKDRPQEDHPHAEAMI